MGHYHAGMAGHGMDGNYSQLRALSEDRQVPGLPGGSRLDPVMEMSPTGSYGAESDQQSELPLVAE